MGLCRMNGFNFVDCVTNLSVGEGAGPAHSANKKVGIVGDLPVHGSDF
jgi:hypothetical protein